MVSTTPATDAISANFHVLAKGTQVAGYTTGSSDIRWTTAQFAEFPDAVRIDQDPAATDHTADILDVENGAATPADCAAWAKQAQLSFHNAVRPGQRDPGIYCSKSMITPVVNALVSGGVVHCNLWVASWGIGANGALSMLNASAGPYPVVGVQYQDNGSFDSDMFLTSWLKNRSSKTDPPKVASPPGQWDNPKFWTWKEAAILGTGLDGQLHLFVFDPAKGDWNKAA
jgi:hypothetical protein